MMIVVNNRQISYRSIFLNLFFQFRQVKILFFTRDYVSV